MPNFEPWRAVRPSAPTPTGQDPLAEAFRNAVNAFGDPSKTYMDGNPIPPGRKLKVPSVVCSPVTPVNRSHPVTPDQSRTVATPSTNQRRSSNAIGAARQELPPLSQVFASTAQD